MLSVLSAYIPEIPPLTADGIYGLRTRAAVLAAQRRFRLPETGNVDNATWNEIYNQYSGIENTSFRDGAQFPAVSAGNFRAENSRTQYSKTSTMTQFPGHDLRMGVKDPVKQEVVR